MDLTAIGIGSFSKSKQIAGTYVSVEQNGIRIKNSLDVEATLVRKHVRNTLGLLGHVGNMETFHWLMLVIRLQKVSSLKRDFEFLTC